MLPGVLEERAGQQPQADVGEDAERGRVYLPAEDLARFRVSIFKQRGNV